MEASRPRLGLLRREPRFAAERSDGIVAAGLLLTLAVVLAQATAQSIDFGVFDLRIAALDSNRHASVFGVASLLAQAAAAVAAVFRSVVPPRRSLWALVAVLIAALLALRVSGFTDRGASSFVLLLPLVAVVFLLVWRSTRGEQPRPAAVVRAGLYLLVFSYVVHALGPALVTALGFGGNTWPYEVKGLLKHGAELGGWMLITTGFAALARRAEAAVATVPHVVLGEGRAQARSSLVEIQRGGSKPPLFCLHAQAGHVRLYYDLARHLGPDQPVYGLRAPEPEGARDPYRRFDEMAEHYIREVREVEPRGPYLLVGECLGGALAYEVAQQLRTAGEDVSLLALVDAVRPGYPRLLRFVPSPAYKALHRARLVGFHFRSLVRLDLKAKLEYVTQRGRRAWLARVARMSQVVRRPVPLLDVQTAFAEAFAAYDPQPYAGRVILFHAARLPLGIERAPDLGWGSIVNHLEIEHVPGYFSTVMSEPAVRILAEKLARCIDEPMANFPYEIKPC